MVFNETIAEAIELTLVPNVFASFPFLTRVSGRLFIFQTRLRSVSFDALTVVEGILFAFGNRFLQTIALPRLTLIGALVLEQSPVLTIVPTPSLISYAGYPTSTKSLGTICSPCFSGSCVTSADDLQACNFVTDTRIVRGSQSLTRIENPSLTMCNGVLVFDSNPNLLLLALNRLTVVNGLFEVLQNSVLTTISMVSLTYVDDAFRVRSNPALSTFSLSALVVSVRREIAVCSNSHSFSAPRQLTSILLKSQSSCGILDGDMACPSPLFSLCP